MDHQRKNYLISLPGIFLFICLLGLITELQAQKGWTQMADMLSARCYFATCVIDSTIYAIGGGGDPVDSVNSSVEICDEETYFWTLKTHLPDARWGFDAEAVDSMIYIMGGMISQQASSSLLMYDPATDSFTEKAPMPTARFAFDAAVVDGKIYVFGGIKQDATDTFEHTSVVEMYDPATDAWTSKASMTGLRSSMATSVVDGKIYVIGGAGNSSNVGLATVEMYDPATDSWSKRQNMHLRRWAPSASVLEGKIYVIGGEKGIVDEWPGLNSVEMYDPATDSWSHKTPMPTSRRGHSSSVLNQKIYVMGGTVGDSQPAIRTVEAYFDTASAPLVYIPDFAFFDALFGQVWDLNGDGAFSYAEVEGVNSLDVSSKNIQDLTGIEAFVNLDTLRCHHNELTWLETSFNTNLVYLDLYANEITYLDLYNNPALKKLICRSNALQELDVSNNAELTYLDFSANSISSLDLSRNINLTGIACSDNDLISLDVSQNPELKSLLCSGNKFDSLDLSANSKLVNLDLSYMPTLTKVCVWESFPEGVTVDTTSSPNVDFVVCSPSGLERHYLKGISIYPNPSYGHLNIETLASGWYTIEIVSQSGQLIYSDRIEGPRHQVDLSNLQKGIYIIRLRSDNFVRTQKLIKL